MDGSSRALAEWLGPPSKYRYRPKRTASTDDILRQIELAESAMHFGSGAKGTEERLTRYEYVRVLRSMPNDLALHYKVWQLLYATRREHEAEQSYRNTCEEMPCDITVGSYHACLTTSSRLRPAVPLVHAGAHRERSAAVSARQHPYPSPPPPHTLELPQPKPAPEFLSEHVAAAPQRPFFAFNPAIAALPQRSAFDWAGTRAADDADVARYVVFFRYSNVRSIWTTMAAGAWQRAVDWAEWRAALSHGHVTEAAEPTPPRPSPSAERRVGAKGGTVAKARPAASSRWSAAAAGGGGKRRGVGQAGAAVRRRPRRAGARPRAAELGAADAMQIPPQRDSLVEADEDEDMDESADVEVDEAAEEADEAAEEAEAGTSLALSPLEAEDELAAVLEQAASKARGQGTAERWQLLMALATEDADAPTATPSPSLTTPTATVLAHLPPMRGEVRSDERTVDSGSDESDEVDESDRTVDSSSAPNDRLGLGSSGGSSGGSSSGSSIGGDVIGGSGVSSAGGHLHASAHHSAVSRGSRAELAEAPSGADASLEPNALDDVPILQPAAAAPDAASDDDLEIFDFDEAPDGTPMLLPATEQWINDQAMALGASGIGAVRGGFSAIGYFTLERRRSTGEVRLGPVGWLDLSAPFPPCECDEYVWSDLSPAICRLAIGAPRLSSLLVAASFAAGVAQLLSGLRRTRAHGRLARARLLRGLLLLGAAMPISNCRTVAEFERCRGVDDGGHNSSSSAAGGSAGGRVGSTGSGSNGLDGGRGGSAGGSSSGSSVGGVGDSHALANHTRGADRIEAPAAEDGAAALTYFHGVIESSSAAARASAGRLSMRVSERAPNASDHVSGLLVGGERWNRTRSRGPPSASTSTSSPSSSSDASLAASPPPPRRHMIEYDGYEDARVLVHRGTLYLLANHEVRAPGLDCH